MYFIYFAGVLLSFLLSSAFASLSCCEICDCQPTSVWCGQKSLNSIPNHIPSKIRRLYMFNNNISSIPEGAFSNLKNLEALDLSSNRLTSEAFTPGVLDGLQKLQSITLAENKLTTIKKETFSGTPQLMQLYLQDNLIEDIEDGAFQNQTKLVELKLGNNRLTKIPQIRHSPNLRRLGLNNNRIQRIEDNALNRINLEELHLSHNKLSRFPSSIFGAINNMRLLDISDNRITTPPTIISNMTSLRTLNLSGNYISAIPGNYLQKSKKLKVLDLSRLRLRSLPRSLIPSRVYLNQLGASDNPWHCNCDIDWLIQYSRRESNVFSNLNNVKCAQPPQLRGRQIMTLTESSEYCKNAPSTTTQTVPRSPEQARTKKPTVDVCDALACANEATCFINQTTRMPACRCLYGWKGLLCDEMIIPHQPLTPPTRAPRPGLVVLKTSVTAHSVAILLPINGKKMTLSTTIITASGGQGKTTHKSIFPTAHMYAVTELEAGTKYNICVSLVDIINTSATRRRIEDQLCAVITTISLPAKTPSHKDEIGESHIESPIATTGEKTEVNQPKESNEFEDPQKTPNSTMKDPENSNMEMWIAVVGGGMGLIIIALIITVLCCRKKKKKQTNNNHCTQISTLHSNGRTVGEGEARATTMQQHDQDPQVGQPLLRQNGYYHYDTPTKHTCPSCASLSRIATPNRNGSLGRSSNSGGSQASVQRHKDRQRCCSKSSDGQYSDLREEMRNTTPLNGTIPRTYGEMRPSFNNREHDHIYNQHSSPTTALDSYTETSFHESNFPVTVVPALSTGTNVNQYHHGSITTAEISPGTTYGYQGNGPVSIGCYPPGTSVARPQPMAVHYTPSKQHHINDDYYTTNHVMDVQMSNPYVKTLKV